MGANRTEASPEAYPAAFLAAIRNGGGLIYPEALPWTTGSSAKRFRLLLALLRSQPAHGLHTNAAFRWHVEALPRALVLRMDRPQHRVVSLAGPILDAALAIGVNPNGTPSESAP